MATTIARYTKALDLVALAMKEQRKGNHINAARLFAAAAKHPTATYAMSVINTTNGASKITAKSNKIKAKRRFKAEADDFDGEETDEDTQMVLDDLDDDTFEDDDIVESDAYEDDEDGDDFDDELDSEEDDISDIVEGRAKARAFAAALSKMRRSK